MKKRVALVLGSGGARGHAHIGVIDELVSRNYEIVCIAGCSMGAIVGGLFAAGKMDAYRDWVESLQSLDMIKLLDVSFRMGAIRGNKLFNRIHQMIGDTLIQDLPMAFTAVATDLTAQQEVWFQEGSLLHAMRASAAIPSLFTPVLQGNRVLVDGGLLNPIPIVPVVSSHCDLIVAVNLNSIARSDYHLPPSDRSLPLFERVGQWRHQLSQKWPMWVDKDKTIDLSLENDPEAPLEKIHSADGLEASRAIGPASLWELVNLSFETMQTSLAQYKIAGYPPDILINIPRRLCRFFDFHRAHDVIQMGRTIAADTLNQYERMNSQALSWQDDFKSTLEQ